MNLSKAIGKTQIIFSIYYPKVWRFSFSVDLFLQSGDFTPSFGIAIVLPLIAVCFNLYIMRKE